MVRAEIKAIISKRVDEIIEERYPAILAEAQQPEQRRIQSELKS